MLTFKLKKMKYLLILFGSLLFITSCSSDLDQIPAVDPQADGLTNFTNVLNAAYFYQTASVTPMAVMGDFRADNAFMFESPYTDYDVFNANLLSQEVQFTRPFYAALYKSILSANIVIEKSTNATQLGEAKFLRALSYFKLVQVFGDVPVNLSSAPSSTDTSILVRRSVATVYDNVIIPDLIDAKAALAAPRSTTGRATKYAAQALLGKVYLTRGQFGLAKTELATVVSSGIFTMLTGANYATVFTVDLNTEILFATQISGSVPDEYVGSDFWTWYRGLDTKSPNPVDARLVAAFTASDAAAVGTNDLRRAVTINSTGTKGNKYPQVGGANVDWIEIRLADVILMYAEALNEEADSSLARTAALVELKKIRDRAGLKDFGLVGAPAIPATRAEVRTAIAKERRLELAFEGQRWFDLLRYNVVTPGTAQAVMGIAFNNNYYLFPLPDSEVKASFGIITQNPGY